MPLSLAYYLITAMSCGSLLGRCVAGFIGDHIGWFNTQILILGLSTTSILGIWLPAEANPKLLWLFVVLFGFCSGSSISLGLVCISQLCKTENYGKVSGTLFAFSSIGYLIGIPVGGLLLQLPNASYRALIMLAGLAYGLGLLCWTAIRVLRGGWKLKARL
ncbi:MFS transporter MCP family solute carrier family 16 member 10 [Penicillium concentricum]|uniref:MFS transporter MCP family solute carrier family 16 member 10 n=1 Tax=Penicillium concentricum TaxID=293559 RepID=A0A9W9R935_9EURO|nr:MFS transporter MCP family solute carrier family 16 member 10 [Penicillium concentricum]KAJ5355851.1 MFS transporter MCP family solute carrier family 16 member 10 [Penicillium concentricum]